MKKSRAFTLLEIIIVMLIVGVILTIVALVLFDREARVRDAKRLSDMRALQSAMLVIKNETGTFEKSYCALGKVSACSAVSQSELRKYLLDFDKMADPSESKKICDTQNCRTDKCDYSFKEILPGEYEVMFHMEKGTDGLSESGCYILSESGINKF